ncbi:MAG: 4Fe-4S binding protein [Oscillospiraceae bacterium]|jgi:carbon-monoxide dehydrogenase iron sulfur subunit|nr:4Fe-4S binding protein [Oscillospiraceae bacterium]
MKKIYVREDWCLGCHLCEYYCANANLGGGDMWKNLKGKAIRPRIRVEGDNNVSFAVQCRHCDEPHCLKGCIAGAISIIEGVVSIDQNKCVGCCTCVLTCPYGCIVPTETGVMSKCELCVNNAGQAKKDKEGGIVGFIPACVQNCPNNAIVVEETEVTA